MAPILIKTQATRRTILQAALSLPAFALFSTHTADLAKPEKPQAEGFVEINGWILKRSDVA
jgi:hypothetical protein